MSSASDRPTTTTTATPTAGGMRRVQALAVAAVLGLALLLAWLARTPQVVAGPVIAQAPGQCIAAPERMRREHPQMLSHQRDRTVHLGERGAAASLQACVNCHATPVSEAPGALRSVIGRDAQFCQGCHQYAAVRLDCFQCHSSRPSGPGHAGGTPSALSLPLTRGLDLLAARMTAPEPREGRSAP